MANILKRSNKAVNVNWSKLVMVTALLCDGKMRGVTVKLAISFNCILVELIHLVCLQQGMK